MAQAASIWVKLGLSTKEFDAGLRKAENDLNRFGNRLSGLGSKMTQGFTIPLGLAGVAAVKTAANMEVAEVAFTTLLGSVEKARKQMEALKNFAKTTPFQFDELTTATRRMLAFGFSVEQTIPMLRTIGDSVSALGVGSEGLNNIIAALGQMQMKGKVSAEEMTRQLGQYIPAWQYLANSLGITVAQAMKKAEQGMIDGATGVRAILEGLANDKRFVGGMEKQAQTLAGIWSNFKDTLSFTLADVGGTIVKTFDLKDKLTGLMEGLQKFSNWFANLNPTIRELAVNFTVFMAVLGPLVLIVGKLITSFSALIGILRLLPTLKIGMLFSDIALYMGGAIKGAWSLTTAMGALSASFAPLLVGGAVVLGLIAIVALISKMANEARLATTAVKDLATVQDVMDTMDMNKRKIAELEQQRESMKSAPFTLQIGGEGGTHFITQEERAQKVTDYESQINYLKNYNSALSQRLDQLQNPNASADADWDKKIKELLAGFGSNSLDTSGGFDLSKFITEAQAKLSTINKATGFNLPTEIYDPLQEKYNLLSQTIQTLIDNGVNPTSTALGDLVAQLNDTSTAIKNRDAADDKKAARSVKPSAGGIKKETDEFTASLKQASEIVSGFSGPLAEFGQATSNLINTLVATSQSISKISFTKSATNPLGAVGGILQSISMLSGVIGAFQSVVSFIDILSGAAAKQQAAAEAQQKAAEEWQEFMETASVTDLFGSTDEIQQQIDHLRDLQRQSMNPEMFEERIEELERRLEEEVPTSIKNMLGITTSDITSAVREVFSAENAEEFTSTFGLKMKEIMRTLQLENFLQGEMKPFFTQMSDALKNAMDTASAGGSKITDAEMAAIKAIQEQIYGKSSAFFEVLDQLGLGMSDLAETTSQATESLKNMPSGFKYATNQYAIAQADYSYIPHYATGGMVPYTPGGRLIVAGENENEWVLNGHQMAAMGGGVNVYVQAPVYGVDDLKTTIKTAVYEAQRQSSMSTAGVR